MNLISKTILSFLLFFSVCSIKAQDEQLSRDSMLIIARTIMDSAECHVFITSDENGKPYAREVTPFKPEDNMTIWIGTSPESRKVKQVQNNPNVIVYYYDPKGMSYVSFSGTASLVNDSDKKSLYWKEMFKSMYPDRDKDYILIKVEPVRLEVFSIKYKIFSEPPKYSVHHIDFN